MLRKLSIFNYAIIEKLEVLFSPCLTVITGETGAGKSIVMEALSLVLGTRADTAVLFDKAKKCVVEAEFDVQQINLEAFFREYDLDESDELLLRREISAAGKSRAFINDTPVNLNVMKQLGDYLVDMHQQQESQEISTTQFQLALLDSLAGQEPLVRDYRKRFYAYNNLLRKAGALKTGQEREVQELDYLNFQWNELHQANLTEGEQQQLELEQQQLEHAEEILRVLASIHHELSDSEEAVLQRLSALARQLGSVEKLLPQSQEIFRRMEGVRLELDDLAAELDQLQNGIGADPTRLEEIQARLDLIYRLEKKHRVNDDALLIQLAADFQKRIDSISIHTEALDELNGEIATARNELSALASKISEGRKKQVSTVVASINSMLHEVGMPHAQIAVEHESAGEGAMDVNGIDRFRFLFSSNKGTAFQEIKKVASGGELSRLMLCFKSLVASSTSLPTLIFDEIDAGISGETAVKVSRILKQLSASHQVICITHLPQIAAKGDRHYFVYKEVANKRTYTRVRDLSEEEKIKAIAKMISGEKPTAASLESAREMLN